MKNLTKITWLLILIVSTTFAQGERGIEGTENWLDNWTEFRPKAVDYGEANQILVGDITENTTLSKRNVYLLTGNVFVTNNATLTIEPGTVILADSESKATLTITKGAKIMAKGRLTDPIVFTSNKSVKKAGDWGGLIVLGDAPTNKFGNNSSASAFYPDISPSNYDKTSFGGENITSNSGVLQFVRIEYAGKKVKSTSVSSALLFAGLGNETVVEHIMVSYSGGNSFNVVGGEINLSNMVSFKSKGNDYKFNYGVQCHIANSLAIRSPYISSTSGGSRCMDIISYDKREDVDFSKKGTSVVAKNMTLITETEDMESDIQSGLMKESLYIGENSSLKIDKSVMSGFSPAVLLSENIQINGDNLEKIQFTNTYFNNCNGNIFTEYRSNNEDLENWYGNPAFFNVYAKGKHVETFIDINNKRPDYRLRIGGIMAMGK